MDMKIDTKNGVYRFRMTLEMTDALGLIHNSTVFRIFEIAELEWFRELGVHWLEYDDVIFPRIDVSASFIRPVRFDDSCTVMTRVERIRPSRIRLSHEIFNETIQKVAIKGAVEFTCVSKETFKPVKIPTSMYEALSKFLDKE